MISHPPVNSSVHDLGLAPAAPLWELPKRRGPRPGVPTGHLTGHGFLFKAPPHRPVQWKMPLWGGAPVPIHGVSI